MLPINLSHLYKVRNSRYVISGVNSYIIIYVGGPFVCSKPNEARKTEISLYFIFCNYACIYSILHMPYYSVKTTHYATALV